MAASAYSGAVAASSYNVAVDVGAEATKLREQNLQRREQLVADRERAVEKREGAVLKGNERKPNFPIPWFYPIYFHDISVDVPERYRSTMRQLHVVLWCTWAVLIWNFICIMPMIYVSKIAYTLELFIAICYMVLGTLGAWHLWYYDIYISWHLNSGWWTWWRFFIYFLAHTLFCCIMAVGIPSCASAYFLFDYFSYYIVAQFSSLCFWI